MRIERDYNFKIKIIDEIPGRDDKIVESSTVEANILFAILNKLEEIRHCIIDVENAVTPGID